MLESFVAWLEANPPGPEIFALLAGIAFAETLFPPFPGDVLFVIASSWAGSSAGALGGLSFPGLPQGSAFHWIAAAVSGFAGCFAATLILLHAGRGMAASRAGGRISALVGRERLGRAEALFRKRGEIVLLGSRFIPGIRSVLVLVAGSSRMSLPRAVVWAGGSALAWYSTLAVLGNGIGQNLDTAREFFRHYENLVLASVAAGLAVVLLARAVRRRKLV